MATSLTTSSRQRSTREPAMGKRSRRPVSGRMVSASDLAQMGRCEKLVVFEHLYGSQRTARQRHPGFEHLDNTEQWRVLEHLTRQPSHVISQALGPLPAKRLSSADFSRQVACLQTLRNAL